MREDPPHKFLPKEILLGALNHPTLRLRNPISVKVEREGEFVIASVPELEEFGYGRHLTEALEDFRQTIIELYLGLETEKGNLGPELERVWRVLQKWMERR